MGWDEVKKINSDMKVPLDVYQYLNDYRLWGEDSYVYQDKSKLHKLYETIVVSMNDLELSGEALEYLTTANKHIGKALGSVYGIERKDTLSNLSTMSAVINSSTAMSAVANSSTAMSAVINSSTAMSALSVSPLRKRVGEGQKATGLILPMSLGGNVYFNQVDDANKYGRIEYVDNNLQTFNNMWVTNYTNWGDFLRQKPLGAKLVRVYKGYTPDKNWIDIILLSGNITNA